jgi:hypothetical protein
MAKDGKKMAVVFHFFGEEKTNMELGWLFFPAGFCGFFDSELAVFGRHGFHAAFAADLPALPTHLGHNSREYLGV